MYVHQHICISPQLTHGTVDLATIHPSVDGKLYAIEPPLDGVPPGMLRRMSKAVRMGIGAGLPLLTKHSIDGIIIGTANGGMEDCIKFLNQIIDYNEGLLTPASFVQSTPNAIAGQLSLITKNRTYNATHTHNGLAFENALLDARMLITETPDASYLVGGVDEISSYNYNIHCHAGWYSKNKSNHDLYTTSTPSTVAGEGAAMFVVNDRSENATAKIEAVEIFQSSDRQVVQNRFEQFLANHLTSADRSVLFSGENGDSRYLPFYTGIESVFGSNLPVVRYKHVSGEFPTASAFGLWLICNALTHQTLPQHFYKNENRPDQMDQAILYNQVHGHQHSFILVSK